MNSIEDQINEVAVEANWSEAFLNEMAYDFLLCDDEQKIRFLEYLKNKHKEVQETLSKGKSE